MNLNYVSNNCMDLLDRFKAGDLGTIGTVFDSETKKFVIYWDRTCQQSLMMVTKWPEWFILSEVCFLNEAWYQLKFRMPS